ncbi:MAG: DMT family transporter [Candidatus Nitrosotenuis sp.]|jgi:drug/metabolite transporter (DMT)-like permease
MSLAYSANFSLILSKLSKVKISTTIGFAAAVLSAAFSALPDVITKPIVDPGKTGSVQFDPILVVLIMYLVTGIFFTPLTRLKKTDNIVIKKTSWIAMIVYGIASASSTIAFSFGLQETTATNASILSNSETVFTVLIGVFVYREYLAKKEIPPFALIAAGAIFLPIGSDVYEQKFELSKFVFGDIMILISGLIYGICPFISKHANDVTTVKVVQVMSLSGACLCIVLSLFFHPPFVLDFSVFSLLSFVGVAGIGGSVMFYVLAARLIGAVRSILIFSSASVFGIVYSVVYLLESIDVFIVSSLILTTTGLYLLNKRRV